MKGINIKNGRVSITAHPASTTPAPAAAAQDGKKIVDMREFQKIKGAPNRNCAMGVHNDAVSIVKRNVDKALDLFRAEKKTLVDMIEAAWKLTLTVTMPAGGFCVPGDFGRGECAPPVAVPRIGRNPGIDGLFFFCGRCCLGLRSGDANFPIMFGPMVPFFRK